MAPHWCSLFGSWFLVLEVPIGLIKDNQLTNDFCASSDSIVKGDLYQLIILAHILTHH